MSKICNSGIMSVVRKVIGDKGYFLINDEETFLKVNQKGKLEDNATAYRVSEKLANSLNNSLNKTRDVGDIFYAKDYPGLIGVQIAPSNNQLAYLNSEEEKEKDKAFEDLQQERQKLNFNSISKAANQYVNDEGDVLPLYQTTNNIEGTLQQGINWLKSIDPNNEIELVNGLINDIGRGSYDGLRNVISASIEYADKGTIKHEKFHQVFSKLPLNKQNALLDEGSKLFNIPRGESKATIKYSQEQLNKVNYTLKSVAILNSNKAIEIFNKGEKNKWSLDRILTELQIPKEQKDIILQKNTNDRQDIITSLLADNSYTVEINTAKSNNSYSPESGQLDDEGIDVPTQHYSNLTVPGGTNGSYIEANIETPMIVPSIQSHAQFKTDNTIGWMRADEKQNYQEKDIDNLIEIMKKSGILEVNCG